MKVLNSSCALKFYHEYASLDPQSHCCNLFRTEQPRNKGGLGKMNIPILADLTKQVSRDYGVLLEEAGISLRLV